MSPGRNAEHGSVLRGTAKGPANRDPERWVKRGPDGECDGYPSRTVIENAEEYRLTLEALADVEIQLAAVDETLCNLPEALRDVMRRALADNRDALLQEIATFEELAGVTRADQAADSPGSFAEPSI